MILRDELIAIGRYNKPHGVAGEISATIDVDIDTLKELSCLVSDIDGIFVPFFVNSCRPKSQETVLLTIDGMRIIGQARQKDAVVSFLVGDIHHLDMGTLLDRLGIAVRTGHHCAQPLMQRLGILGTVRASFALYNTRDEVDRLVEGIRRVASMF